MTRDGRATLFMTLLAAFQIAPRPVQRPGRHRCRHGHRQPSRLETEGLIGFFANTLVLRTDLSGDPSFLDVLGRVREVALGAYSHQDLPFEQLVKALRPERIAQPHAVVPAHVRVPEHPGRELALDGITADAVPVEHDTAMFDLTLTLSEVDDGLAGTLEYSTDLYDRATAERIVRHFRNLLEAIVADPHRPIDELDLLDDRSASRCWSSWNDTRTRSPTAASTSCSRNRPRRSPTPSR